jgi:hypothetical protein
MLAAWVFALAAASGPAAAQPPLKVPEQGYLCCNMRTDGAWISDSNYAERGKQMIPAGTPVKFVGYGRYRVHVEIEGRSQAIGNDYSRELPMEEFALRYIWPQSPHAVLDRASPRVRRAAESGRITRGMTRPQVLIAMGFPIASATPRLDAPVWKYWLWSFTPFAVHFGDDGTVTHVSTDPVTMHKVYLD